MEIVLQDQSVHKDGKKLTDISKFCQVVAENCLTGLHKEPIPDNVKWIAERGEVSVYFMEFQPELRSVLWGADGYESEGDGYYNGGDWVYEHEEPTRHTIATPYVNIATMFNNGVLYAGRFYVYYRNNPLQSIDDPLYQTNLFNVGGTGNACIYPQINSKWSRVRQLSETVNHFWSGEFNGHMGGSQWHEFMEYSDDPRLASIEAWEKASLADPEFVLDVKWKLSTMTPRKIMENLTNGYCGFGISHAKMLGNLMLAH